MDARELKKVYFWVLTYVYEIISFIAWSFIGYIALHYYSKPQINFLIYLLILLALHILLITVRGKEASFVYFPFKSYGEHANWIGSGNFDLVRSAEAFRITSSHNGFIYSKTPNWVNYKLSFQFKIVHKSIGIIFRAANLSNYIMFQIFENKIKPHLRTNGLWVFFGTTNNSIPFIELVDLSPALSKDKWYALEATCEKDLITIVIKDVKKVILNRVWTIPEGKVLFPLMIQPIPVDVPFSMNLDYGTFGVRNDGSEMALIKDFFAKKI